MKNSKLKVAPVTVGNPVVAASLAIDQSHLEEFVSAEERSSVVECKRPPKGVFFTVRAETPGEPWKDRGFYFLLELEGRDPYIVAPAIAKEKAGGRRNSPRLDCSLRYDGGRRRSLAAENQSVRRQKQSVEHDPR